MLGCLATYSFLMRSSLSPTRWKELPLAFLSEGSYILRYSLYAGESLRTTGSVFASVDRDSLLSAMLL